MDATGVSVRCGRRRRLVRSLAGVAGRPRLTTTESWPALRPAGAAGVGSMAQRCGLSITCRSPSRCPARAKGGDGEPPLVAVCAGSSAHVEPPVRARWPGELVQTTRDFSVLGQEGLVG